MEAASTKARLLTPEELGVLIRTYREMRRWSQEQLAAIGGLSTRTVQRVENGKPSDLDTRRALARAFEFDDIDILNKPLNIPTAEDLEAAKVAFEREHVTLKAQPVRSGRQLAGLAESNAADLCTPGFDISGTAAELFARLVDYIREYRDCQELYTEVDKLSIYEELQRLLDDLKGVGVSLCFSERNMSLKAGGADGARPLPVSILYLVAYRSGGEPEEFVTRRTVQFS